MPEQPSTRLARKLNLSDAVIFGLSAMIGSGIFVAITPAIEASASWVLVGILIAAFVAFCNATSSAQLAALYPESGGTYVYGRIHLRPFWGWLAGWTFVVGKIASCAAAALAFGYYINPAWAKYLALAAVVGLTAVNYFGIKKSAAATWIMTLFVVSTLGLVFTAGLFGGTAHLGNLIFPRNSLTVYGILQSAGLMFFAFAGYARIATLGEEVQDPRTTIPQAIMTSLGVTVLIYLAVTLTVLLSLNHFHIIDSAAPLVEVVNVGVFSFLAPVVRLAAMAATLGVLLSLILGISRTVFAMAANRDLPRWLSAVHPRYKVPHRAEIIVGLVLVVIILVGNLRAAISFSAFAILVYYAITNVCALKIPKEKLLWPRFLAVTGLVLCLLLALSLPLQSVLVGMITILLSAIFYYLNNFLRKIFRKSKTS